LSGGGVSPSSKNGAAAKSLGVVGGQRAAALLAEELEVLRGEDAVEPGPVGEVVDVDHAVVLQVVTHRQVLAHRDPERRDLAGRADAGEHQQHG
jgi:hypothetical protein